MCPSHVTHMGYVVTFKKKSIHCNNKIKPRRLIVLDLWEINVGKNKYSKP